jgi:hypothetical protein
MCKKILAFCNSSVNVYNADGPVISQTPVMGQLIQMDTNVVRQEAPPCSKKLANILVTFVICLNQAFTNPHPIPSVISHLAAASNNHLVNWSEVEVVAKESHWYKRKIHEAATMIVSDAVLSQPSWKFIEYGTPY